MSLKISHFTLTQSTRILFLLLLFFPLLLRALFRNRNDVAWKLAPNSVQETGAASPPRASVKRPGGVRVQRLR